MASESNQTSVVDDFDGDAERHPDDSSIARQNEYNAQQEEQRQRWMLNSIPINRHRNETLVPLIAYERRRQSRLHPVTGAVEHQRTSWLFQQIQNWIEIKSLSNTSKDNISMLRGELNAVLLEDVGEMDRCRAVAYANTLGNFPARGKGKIGEEVFGGEGLRPRNLVGKRGKKMAERKRKARPLRSPDNSPTS